MNHDHADRDRAEYLARLDDAMRDVPHGIAREIRAGIAEELEGAAPDELSSRIVRLGDPEEIAREATRAGATEGLSPVAAEDPVRRPSATETRGFAILAALVLGFGTFLLPLVGWVVGVVLVCLSRLWRTGEKVVAILLPLATVVILGGVAAAGWSSGQSAGDGSVVSPAGVHLTWILLVTVAFLVIPATGLWLLWRIRGRSTPTS